ncbi:MAG: M3 family oligoendopeptidase [Alphaproteobacteria bacterium]|nr:M3 family oligoendopeptidase [Alphaproteobacteria bacterium]
MTHHLALDTSLLPLWDLSDLYPAMDSAELARDFARLETLANSFNQDYKGKLAALDADGMLESITRYEGITEIQGRIISYADLLHAGDVGAVDISKFHQACHEDLTRIEKNLLFFTLEINRLEDGRIDHWLESSAALDRYRCWFDTIRHYRPHQLDDRLEELMMEKSLSGRAAWVRLFDETMATLTYDFADPLTGETHSIGTEEALNYLSDSTATRRKAAARCLSDSFGKNIRLFSHITNSLIKDKEIDDRWRHFDNPASARDLSNCVESHIITALISAVKAAYPRLSHRYYRLKAAWLNTDKLDWWDRNAPLPDSNDDIYQWPDARKIILTAYQTFSPEMARTGAPFFDNNWIDAPVRDHKSPGAFAHPTVPSAHPYLLLNYQGKTRDVMTLAHELGHGIHQLLAAPRGPLLSDTPLTLAETASVFGEMLTFRSLLSGEKNPRKRKVMIAAKVEDMLNTVVRQVAFYDFETRIHTQRKNGELSADDLGDIWMAVQRESLGDAIRLDDSYRNFWCYIPHFIHSPFYVYAYAFGDCLVNSLYATYQQQPDGFAEKYLDMLRAGGSLHHKELLKPFGLNAGDPGFWTSGLNMISDFIDEMEKL